MIIKIANLFKIFHNLIKKRVRLKLNDYEIYEKLLYIDQRLYILNDPEFKIKFIKYIYEFLLKEYAKKSSIYDKINCYYY